MLKMSDSLQLLMTHNFPSLNDRTKMLSFFTVTSSWQSGEMTLLHRNKRKSRGQKMWYYACVCMYARVRQWSGGRVSELMTKVISGKGHADGLQEMASPKNKDKTNACDEERCVRGCVPTHSMRCCCRPESRGATELFQCQGLTHRRQHWHYGDLISIRRLPACSGWMLSLQHSCHFSLTHVLHCRGANESIQLTRFFWILFNGASEEHIVCHSHASSVAWNI